MKFLSFLAFFALNAHADPHHLLRGFSLQEKEPLITYINDKYNIKRNQAAQILAATDEAAETYKVEPTLVLAIIERESGFRLTAKNGSFTGLMQLSSILTGRKKLPPRENVKRGTEYLAMHLSKSKSVLVALQKYNGSTKKRQYASAVLKLKRNLDKVANS